jgi:hypothetical protein
MIHRKLLGRVAQAPRLRGRRRKRKINKLNDEAE